MSALADSAIMPIWRADEGAQAALAVFTTGPHNCSKFLNGRVAGNVMSDTVGALTILQEQLPGLGGLVFTVPQDLLQPNFQFPFSILLFAPFVTFTWTQGAAPSTFLRATVSALPQL